jgi:hypothetical protein
MNDGRTVMLDFREVAPAAASVDMFVGKPGLRYPTIKNTTHTHTCSPNVRSDSFCGDPQYCRRHGRGRSR